MAGKTKEYSEEYIAKLKAQIRWYYEYYYPELKIVSTEIFFYDLAEDVNNYCKKENKYSGDIIAARYIRDIYYAYTDTSKKNAEKTDALNAYLNWIEANKNTKKIVGKKIISDPTIHKDGDVYSQTKDTSDSGSEQGHSPLTVESSHQMAEKKELAQPPSPIVHNLGTNKNRSSLRRITVFLIFIALTVGSFYLFRNWHTSQNIAGRTDSLKNKNHIQFDTLKRYINREYTVPTAASDEGKGAYILMNNTLIVANDHGLFFTRQIMDTLDHSRLWCEVDTKDISVLFIIKPEQECILLHCTLGPSDDSTSSLFKENEYRNDKTDSLISFCIDLVDSLLCCSIPVSKICNGAVVGYYDNNRPISNNVYDGGLGLIENEKQYSSVDDKVGMVVSYKKSETPLYAENIAFLRAYNVRKTLLDKIGNLAKINKDSLNIIIRPVEKEHPTGTVILHLTFDNIFGS